MNAAADRLHAAHVLDDLFIGETFIGSKHDQRPSHCSHRNVSGLGHLPRLLSCLVREAYNIDLHAGAFTIGIHLTATEIRD